MIDRARLERYVTDSRRRFEDLLGQMVEIPSISMDPAKAPDIRRMADFARQVLTDLGAEAQIVETGGYPIVSGGWVTGAHHPTVTIYNHMDVQPAQEPEWKQSGLKVLVQHQYPGHSRNQGVAHGTVSTIGPHGA